MQILCCSPVIRYCPTTSQPKRSQTPVGVWRAEAETWGVSLLEPKCTDSLYGTAWRNYIAGSDMGHAESQTENGVSNDVHP